jgi:hypothetical protein
LGVRAEVEAAVVSTTAEQEQGSCQMRRPSSSCCGPPHRTVSLHMAKGGGLQANSGAHM